MIRIVYLLSVLFLFSTISQAENSNRPGTVSGFVYDAQNGEALIGANVVIKGTSFGATTNLSGYFVITGAPTGEHVLIVTYMGYRQYSQKIRVGNAQSEILKLYLQSDVVKTNEIVISGDSVRTIEKLFVKPISKVELNAKQINSIPRVIEADLLRSLQTLPGIQPLSDFSSELFVRGGTPDQNLYMIDGTDVYNPEHAFGLFSTFNTTAIKKVEMSKGGFSAEYGGRLSSVLNVTNLDGNRNRFQGEVGISLLSASTTLQAPLGSFGSISGSFRRTYIDQTYAKVVDEIPDYYFFDGNLKAFLDLGEKDKVVVSFYGGRDVLDYKVDKDKPNSIGFKYDWGNTTGSINWKRIFTPELFASFWVTGSRFNSHFNFEEVNLTEDNTIEDLTFKGNLEYYFSKEFNLKFGFEQKNLFTSYKEDFPGGLVDAGKYRNHYTGYLTTIWRPTDSWDIETGLRYDYFKSSKDYWNLDPRFALKYRLSETSILKFSTGIFHQYLNRIPRMFLSSIWTGADEYVKGSTAYHYILGFEKEIADIYEFSAEVYYKRYKDIYSYNETFIADIEANRYDENDEPVFTEASALFNRGDAKSYGVEFLIRKDYGSVTGWLGYSLARTENTMDNLNRGKSFVPRHDRTSTVNAVVNFNIGEVFHEMTGDVYRPGSSKWLFSMNFIYSTGQPITLPGSAYYIKTMPDWGGSKNNMSLYPTELNELNLPSYARMDISLTWEKQYSGWTLAPYLQIYNIGNRKNVWFIQYDNKIENNRVVQDIDTVNMLPILPSIGVNIKF
ncbi:MAG: TonB-dependent receptor [Bacteroidota bacterium]